MDKAGEDDRFRALDRFRSLPEAILAARRAYGSDRVAFEDIEGTTLTYGQLALAGAVLERGLRARFAPGRARRAAASRRAGRRCRAPRLLALRPGAGDAQPDRRSRAAAGGAGDRPLHERHRQPRLRREGRARRARRRDRGRGAPAGLDRGPARGGDPARQARGARHRPPGAARDRPRDRGGGALHLGDRGRAEGGRAHSRQPPRQRRPAPGPGADRPDRPGGVGAAALPQFRADRRDRADARHRHPHRAPSLAAPLPGDPRAREEARCDDPPRHRHLPPQLGPAGGGGQLRRRSAPSSPAPSRSRRRRGRCGRSASGRRSSRATAPPRPAR